jgi:hypothetical protein
MAAAPWPESISPPVHRADLTLPQSWNIRRVTEDHRLPDSIAEAHRSVSAVSAQIRRDASGVPTGEPEIPRPTPDPAPGIDRMIVRGAIHPAIGVARIGDSATEYYIGLEVTDPAPAPAGFIAIRPAL